MKHAAITFTMVLACLSISAPYAQAQLSGSYTIDAALSAGGTNYQTFTAAVTDLAAHGLSGDVIFRVAADTYDETITIPALSYTGTLTYWTVTFDGGVGNSATRIISYLVPSNDVAIITLNGADHVSFKNLTIRSTHESYGVGILFTNSADHNEISDCRIEVSPNATTSYCIGILASTIASNPGATGTHGSFNQINNNTITGGYYGIRWSGYYLNDYSRSRGNRFIGNSITMFYSHGIYLRYGGALVVRGNTIIQRTIGASSGYGIYAYYLNDGTEISYNYSKASTFGAFVYDLNSTYDSQNPNNRARFFNNMFISSTYGMYFRYPRNADIMHNSCRVSSTGRYSPVYGFASTSPSTGSPDVRCLNNMIDCYGNGVVYAIHVAANVSSTYTAFDNNLCEMSGAGSNRRFYWNGGYYNTLAELKLADNNFHQSSIEADPMWIGTDDLHSTSAAASGAGRAVVGIGDDFDGEARNSPPCIGADEFVLATCTITCPDNIQTSNAPGVCGAIVTFTPTVDAACGPVTCIPASGSFFPVGTTTVLCIVDGGPQCSFTVTVTDTEPPSIAAPDITMQNDPGQCSAAVYFTPVATDNCPSVGTVACTPASGSVFQKGTTPVYCSVTDAHNNTTTMSFNVVVLDAEPPVITTAAFISLWPPDHSYVTVPVAQMLAAISDNCDQLSASDVIIIGATSDEPETGPGTGAGNTHHDMVISPDCRSIDVRRERDGISNGRVYSITLRATDIASNSTTAVFKVYVPHDINEACIEDAAMYSVTSSCGTAKTMTTLTSPAGFTLEQNYPNPFAGGTGTSTSTITYMVPHESVIGIRVFDVHGRLVRTLVDDLKPAGYHAVNFDGSALPGGVYFYTLEADNATLKRKMVLLK